MTIVPNRKADYTGYITVGGCRYWYSFWWDEMFQSIQEEFTRRTVYFNITIVDGDWLYRQVDYHDNNGRYCHDFFFQENHHKIMNSYAAHCVEKELLLDTRNR
jgi:hypothetical protein